MTNILSNRQQFERQRQDPNQEGVGIQAQSFGGLNTVSNPLSIPYEDSPLLLNATVDVSGSIEKRKGTRVVRHDNSAAQGITIVPITTALSYSYQVVKNGTGLSVFELVGNQLVQRMTKANVWSQAAADIKATYCATNEAEARILFCTGVNVPVQLTFTESRTLVTATAAQTTVTVPNAERLKTANTNNALCYVDGVLVTASYSFNTTNKALTVTVPAMTAGNRVIDIELITWQWWAEALFYYGDRFWDSVPRFHDKPTDRHIAIPENLRDGIEPRKAFPNLFPMTALMYVRPSYFFQTPVSDRTPISFYQYAFSDGSTGHPSDAVRVGSTSAGQTTFTITTTNTDFQLATPTNTIASFNNTQVFISSISYSGTTLTVTLTAGVAATTSSTFYVVFNPYPVIPSPFFVTFGSVDNTRKGLTETLYLARERALPFNGGNGIINNNLHVQRDSTVQSMNGSAYGDYRLYSADGDYAQLISNNAVAGFIDFTGGTEAGVPANARIRIVNKEKTPYVGSSATTSNDSRTDGSWVPCYGLASYANYATGSFPRNVTTFQGRLVFSGFPQNPLLVCFSSVTDSTIPGEFYASFQQDAFTNLPTDPLDVLIGGAADDYVTGLAEYQGSLFVFTRKATYRVSTTGRGTVTADNVNVVSVASIGLVNAQSLARAEDTIMFLSDEGVYIIVNGSAAQESTEYRMDELSTKVRNKFGANRLTPSLAWTAFDNTNKTLLVALPKKDDKACATTLLTFTTFRQAWAELDTPGQFNTLSGVTCQSSAGESVFLLVVSRAISPTRMPLDTTYLRMHDSLYLDYITSGTGTGSSQTLNIQPLPTSNHTTRLGVRDYRVSFKMLPLVDVQDVRVTLDGVELAFGTDFIKTQGNTVRLLGNVHAGKPLVVAHRRPDTDYPNGRITYNTNTSLNLSHAVVMVDNVTKREFSDFTQSNGAVTLTAGLNTKIEIGSAYPTLYATPLFTWNTLKQFKRLLYWLGFFDNGIAQDTFTEDDVNALSGQPNEEIVGMPKTRLDCNISFVYNSHDSGDTSADLYGFEELVWDVSLFDTYLPLQTDNFVLLKQALQGVGYSFQGIVWTTDEASFKMVGYQLDGKMKGNKYTNWSN